ncbi:Dabb family protein [Yoonia sp. SS1-5]|uniref:Dabb family protein n=1 Tax=Yoonia rhodophyticola TaxID=3137370 RepID=A0AAN0NM32_9RHOB
MIRHIVLLNLAPDHDAAALQSVMVGLDDLRADLPGFVHFEHGPNRDFENMSPDYDYGFICHFIDAAQSQAYLVNPVHQALGTRLVALCAGGVAGIMVVDLALTEGSVA